MAIRNLEIEVLEKNAGERLDQFLAHQYPDYSRAYIQKKIAQGKILINQAKTRKGHLIHKGDRIQIQEILEIKERRPSPNAQIPIVVVHRDETFWVVEKPPGLPTHPVTPEETNTLANWWIAQDPKILDFAEDPLRPGIVHRLDTDTSGLILLARTPDALGSLQDQFRSRRVYKTYRALVWGHPPDSGTIDFPLAHDPKSKRRMRALQNSKDFSSLKSRPALTDYRVQRKFADFSLVQVHTRTGRMHQVRVHMAAIGHPLVGDKIYRSTKPKKDCPFEISRHFLHATTLAFFHPTTQEKMEFHSLLPPDLEAIISKLIAD
jgi:23S rRNA pseudouridine1911/1915/1917 synthase